MSLGDNRIEVMDGDGEGKKTKFTFKSLLYM